MGERKHLTKNVETKREAARLPSPRVHPLGTVGGQLPPRQRGPHSNFFLLGAAQSFAKEEEVLTYRGFLLPGTRRTHFQIGYLRL